MWLNLYMSESFAMHQGGSDSLAGPLINPYFTQISNIYLMIKL